MALTINSGMNVVTASDDATNWAATRFSGGGQAPAASLDTTVTIDGAGSIGGKLAGNNWNSALVFDWYASTEGGKSANTTVNLTTVGNEVIAVWCLVTTPAVLLNLASGGLYLIISSSADSGVTNPSVYSEWWISGADVFPGGFVRFLVDTRKTPSSVVGGGANLSAVRRIGIGARNISSVGQVKADNVYVDSIAYGRPNYSVQGDGATVAKWSDFLTHSTVTAINGLIEDVGGAYLCSCGFTFGGDAQGATTDFNDSSGTQIIMRRHTYHNGTSVTDALNYTDYYTLRALGSASFSTSLQLGSVVGSGDDRQGVLGGGIRSADSTNVPLSVDFATDIAHLTGVKMYGVDFVGVTGGLAFDDSSKTSIVSVAFQNCGLVDLGTTNNGAELLNFALIDPLGATNNRGLLIKPLHNIKNGSFITSGSPTTQHMVYFDDASDYTVSFDSMNFYGDYSSGTLWHGENSGLNADVTINASASNPTQAEFNNTNGGTITVSAAVTVTFTGLQDNTEIRILDSGTQNERQGVENTSGGSQVFSEQASTSVDIVIFHISYDPVYILNFSWPSTPASIPIQQNFSRNYSNP